MHKIMPTVAMTLALMVPTFAQAVEACCCCEQHDSLKTKTLMMPIALYCFFIAVYSFL